MITGTGIPERLLEELELYCDADKWFMAYQLTGSRQDVYHAMADAAIAEHRSVDRTVCLLVFADKSLIVFSAGEDETYADVGDFAETYEDIDGFYAEFPSIERPA